ncbi:Stp1/IreP family PP2C-type Ser/Thr phosphatase [Dolosigranulum savutiense]|uniref:Stp1/IreP family PP2C-type Ser/Thr phosphatase n=1 Tax=Dolosigranulum savutiense TaxID=3110288 RepID=A0AB74TNZ0_9LACT
MGIQIDSFIGNRLSNEDYAAVFMNRKQQVMAVLCDGMGGHNGGEVASRQAVEQLGDLWKITEISNQDELTSWITTSINRVNAEIYQAGQEQPDLTGMGTTLVAMFCLKHTIIIANVGDSRAYIVNRQHQVEQITEDHSYAHELFLRGEITKQEELNHQQRHMLTRSLGVGRPIEVDLFQKELTDIRYLFLCSDGLSNNLSDSEILSILNQETCSNAAKSQALIDQSYKNGSNDNISIVLMDMDQMQEGGS